MSSMGKTKSIEFYWKLDNFRQRFAREFFLQTLIYFNSCSNFTIIVTFHFMKRRLKIGDMEKRSLRSFLDQSTVLENEIFTYFIHLETQTRPKQCFNVSMFQSGILCISRAEFLSKVPKIRIFVLYVNFVLRV